MKHIKYLVFAITGFIFISCGDDFLNPLPDSAVSVDLYFQSDADVLAGVIGIYDAIQGVNENTTGSISNSNRGVQFEHLLTEHRTDNTRNSTLEGSKSDFHRYVVTANNVESEDYWQSMYEVIFRANNILDFIDIADASNRARYSAEAKFLRAFAYFKLVRLYGDVPLITSPTGPEENDLLFTRVAKEVVYAQIIEDLQEAAATLDNSSKSRASKAAAQGLLAKVYLTQGTNYAAAQQLCESIVNSMDYSLESDFNDVFYNELNNEIIFAIQYTSGNSLESQSFSSEFTSGSRRQGGEDGQNIINANLITEFEAIGGNRTSVSYVTFPDLVTEVTKFLPEGSDLSNPSTPTYGASSRNAGNDFIVLRYADVLLMHAEAILAGGTETISGPAIDSYMGVRERAGFDAVADRPSILTKEALLSERRVELAFENQRWFDLIRFGVADLVLGAHSIEMGYIYTSRALLLPIPSREINLSNGLLKQNPGY